MLPTRQDRIYREAYQTGLEAAAEIGPAGLEPQDPTVTPEIWEYLTELFGQMTSDDLRIVVRGFSMGFEELTEICDHCGKIFYTSDTMTVETLPAGQDSPAESAALCLDCYHRM